MRVDAIVICSVLLLSLAGGYALKCSKCTKNECECQRKIMKATILDPPSFESIKHCEETNPTDLKPVKDICSCVDVSHVRPCPMDTDEPKFAPSTSCECGYQECKPPPKKYPADVISKHLAALAARKKTISETDLFFHGPPLKVLPCPKPVITIPEELLHKLNRQPIELQPPKKKHIPRVESSEEEKYPCYPEKQYYSEICYGKIEHPHPAFEQIKPEEVPCPVVPDVELSTECPETEEECDTAEEIPDESAGEEEEDCVEDEECSEEYPKPPRDCNSGGEEEYKKRSVRLPIKAKKDKTLKRKL